MKTARLLPWLARSVFLFSSLILATQQAAHASGVVTNATEADLRAAMVGGGLVTFDCDGTITLASQLSIDTDTTLDATGHSITLSGGGTTRVLGVASGVKLMLKRLTVSDGYVSMGSGGGLLNSGEATISDCTFSNNTVVNGPQFGGAINHQGAKLVITGTTFIGNNAAANGGALSCGHPSTAIGNIAITNCTFYGNGGFGAASFGQAIVSPVMFVNCTFASNNFRAIQVFSGGSPSPARVRVVNSILAYTVGGDNLQGIEDWGYNISSDNSASLTNGTSIKNTGPLLGPLTNNGGPTRTMGLFYGSPAIDAANDTAAPGTDQRGVVRPTRAHSDIGAFEGSISPGQNSTVHFTSTNFAAGEGQGTGLVQVERTGSTAGTAGITVSATAGTATAGTDFAPTNIALVFAEGEMQKSVPVSVINDTGPEANETVLLSLSNPVATVADSPGTAQLTIIDDDEGYVLTNYTDAGLRAAVANGGWIQFPSNGTITLTSPIEISQFTVLDASGNNVVLSGGSAVRLFNIHAGVPLTLMNLTIANGRHQGVNGATGTDGGPGSAGAINVGSGILTLLGCRIWTNTVAGGAGGNGNPNGSGGGALGGAVYLNGGTLNATNSEFVGNLAIGGPGGTNSVSGGSGTGGPARGGAIFSSGGLLHLDNCSFASNAVTGGRASLSSSVPNAGTSGEASGGAWFNDGGTAVVTRCSFRFNDGSTLTPPVGFTSGSGGTVRGGSICNFAGLVSVLGTEFTFNRISGGGAVFHRGTAGSGLGGAIYNLGSLDVAESLMRNNSAIGGNAGLPAGDGKGGAIFNGGQLGITQTELQTNTVQGGRGDYRGGPIENVSGTAQGGAVFTTNVLALSESTLSGNGAYGAAGGIVLPFGPFPGYPAYGGAIYSSGNSFLTNNTLTANVAGGGSRAGSSIPSSYTAGGDAYGGGLFCAGGTTFLFNNTLAANAAQGGTGNPDGNSYGGGIANQGGAVTFLNTIVANSPSGSNSFGTLTDAGHNLSSDTSCNFTNTGSLNSTDPKLGSLDDYGGPTATMPLLAGSPAIDGGDSGSFPPTDQRGRARPYGASPDIGAFESSPPFVIRGTISGDTFKDEVSVAAGATTVSTTNHGSYSLSLSPSTYSITPQSPDYIFVPTNRSVIVGPDQLGVNFKAYHWNALSIEDVSNGVLHFAYAGTNGQTYRVLVSSNLTDWFAISTNTVGNSNLFHVFDTMSERIRFYRMQRL